MRGCEKNFRLEILLAAAACIAGCTQSSAPQFRLDMPQIVRAQLQPENRQAIADVLGALFGTPDEPFVPPELGLDVKKLKLSAGPTRSTEQGLGGGLYRQHCVHCHGITGDGRGPTAQFLNPYPRDYRPAVYKFKSTYNPSRPTDEDLHKVLRNGVPGTAMPSFALLPPAEIDALVEYVKYLSMRGQMETALIDMLINEVEENEETAEEGDYHLLDPKKYEYQRELINDALATIAGEWQESVDNVILPAGESLPPQDRTPEQIADSVDHGRELFYGTKANCIKCHGPTGLGDGQQDDQDNWNKAVVAFRQETESLASSLESQEEGSDEDVRARRRELAERLELLSHMLSPRNAIPRNLRTGAYRGGVRPLDIFRKVYTGIAGTPMPGLGPATPGAQGTLTEEEMWQLVDYVRSLPFEPASEPRHLRINFEEVLN
jgi:mono/diheme cytochrome c family protein